MKDDVLKNSCRNGIYKSNTVVRITVPIVCYGFAQTGQPTCEHLPKCMEENGLYFDKAGRRRKR